MNDNRRQIEERTDPPDVVFLSTELSDRLDPLSELSRDAEERGLSIESSVVPDGRSRASVEWFDPTAFALFILAPPYVMLFNWVLEHVPALWRKFFDADNPERIRATIVTTDGPMHQDHSLTFSVWAAFRYGQVKLMFPEECSEARMSESCRAFGALMHAYMQGKTYDDIDLDKEVDCYFGVIVVEFAPEEGRLRVLNPFWKLQPDALENLRRSERERRGRDHGTRGRIEPWIGPQRPPKHED